MYNLKALIETRKMLLRQCVINSADKEARKALTTFDLTNPEVRQYLFYGERSDNA